MRTDKRINDIVQEWCQERPAVLCVLLGSQITGRTRSHSDIDLTVWPARQSPH